MFVMLLNYIKPLEEVDRVLPDHIPFLQKYFDEGKFICAGRQNPRVGGVIICKAVDRAEAEAIAAEDPFSIEKVAEYNIIEFDSSRCAKGLEALLG